MHLTRRRFSSAAAAPFSGYVENNRPPPPDEFCAAGVDEEMSSDATFLCQESEPEDEIQSLLHEQNTQLFEARLREEQQQALPYCTRAVNLPPGLEGFPTTSSFPLQRQPPPMPNVVRFGADVFQRELFRPRRGPALSWGFQQDLAEYEASLQNGYADVGGMLYPHQQNSYVMSNDRQLIQAQQPRRSSQGGNREGISHHVQNEDMHGTRKNGQQQKPNKNRRRGRRGGRGKKNPDRLADDAPKLEKNLEDELAQEMANHMSNKSALAHSFSSLRLHVAGGGTMIILNDKEITGSHQPPSIESRDRKDILPEGSSVIVESCPRNEEQVLDGAEMMHEMENNAKTTWPKGCGAFFPPQVLKQLQGDAQNSNPDPSFVSQPSTPASGHNVKQTPYTPSESTQSIDRGMPQQHRGKPGTGCFIPSYSQDPASPEMDPSQVLESVSLVESLACLENSEELLNPAHDAPSAECELLDGTDLCYSDGSTALMDTIRRGSRAQEDVSQVGSSGHDPANDLIQLIENDDYTTFTSPLHLEDTLDGLQAEREAREETEQKLIDLQIENDELRGSVRRGEEIEAELQKMKEHNAILQVLLFFEWNKSKKAALKKKVPLGLTNTSGGITSEEPPHENVTKKEKPSKDAKKDDDNHALKAKRPKSALKSASMSSKSVDLKKPLKPEKKAAKTVEGAKKKETEDSKPISSEAKHHLTLKSATGGSGVKKHPVRCPSHHRPADDIGEDVKKNKRPATGKTAAKHSRASSSCNTMRF